MAKKEKHITHAVYRGRKLRGNLVDEYAKCRCGVTLIGDAAIDEHIATYPQDYGNFGY